MADAAVEFLLETLKQLVLHRAKLVKNFKSELEQLERDVGYFKSFLKKVSSSSKKLRKEEYLRAVLREIRGVIYEAEDIIDAMVSQAAEAKTARYFSFSKAFNAASFIDMANSVTRICTRITDIQASDSFKQLSADNAPNKHDLKPTSLRRDNVVGLKDEAVKILGYLNESTPYLDVISIVGMPGLGKTTFTGKIFHDSGIDYKFHKRIWVDISQEFVAKEVFRSILRKLGTRLKDDEYSERSALELAEDISGLLEEAGEFLLVMDDVWEPKDWDELKVCLPRRNPRGKVMITSRQEAVGKYANRFRTPHHLRKLNLEESCELLQWEVFSKAVFPPEFDRVGREIADKCDGLPLAIVVIGGVLTTKISRSVTAWEKVSKSISTFLELEYDPENRMNNIIALSYDKLPYHLKECFLYVGMFPEDFVIPAWKLIRMWIAEGLILPKAGLSMEEVAEHNLDDLINRNLVRVEKLKADGRVKSFRIHDMLRAFCINEGGKDREDFFQEIKKSCDGGLQPSVTEREKHRRLCIHSQVMEFLNGKPKGLCVRSFVTFSEDIEVPKDKISAISDAFKLLRVSETKPLRFSKIPIDFYTLFHLRYLALSMKREPNSNPSTLPKALTKLWHIQTLLVDTDSAALDIKADVMSMTQLRNLKTNVCTTLAKPDKDSRAGDKLQRLGIVSPESCTEALLGRARSLKKLGVCGKLSSFLDDRTGTFGCLTNLSNLEKLKLLNDVFPKAAIDGKLDGLPPACKFPVELRSLTLLNTFLDWTHMSTLESLEKLRVLKLKEYAFVGPSWKVESGFEALEFLHIERTDLSTWKVSARHFPRLKRLELLNCEELEEVPIVLADIPNLEFLDLQCCKKAAASVRKIATAKKDVATFAVSISPPDA